MNSKKHKSKNRPKVNPLPPQKERQNVVEVPNKCEDTLSSKIPENEIKNEEITQKEEVKEVVNAGREENSDVMVQSVSESVTGDSPVKPKRNKGKKKKHATAVESDQENKVEERQDTEIGENNVNMSENKLIENTSKGQNDIQPSVRKKKTKSKKQIHLSTDDAAESKSDAEFSHPEDSKVESARDKNEDKPKSEVTVSSKKNKKKKRRHDSEKSEKAEEQLSCTAAFKELIDETDDKNNLVELSVEVNENVNKQAEKVDVTSLMETTPEQDLEKIGNTKSNKKKRKEKKYPPKVKDEVQDLETNVEKKEDIPWDSNRIKTDGKLELNNEESIQATVVTETVLGDLPQRPLTPGIVLPQSDDLEVPELSKTKNQISASSHSEDLIQNLDETNQKETLTQSDSLKDNVFDTKLSSTKKDDDLICTEIFKEPVIILENAEDNNKRVQSSLNESDTNQVKQKDDVPIFKAEISKSASDVQKPIIDASQNDSIKNKVDDSIKTEQLSENTPDFIQIPRSSSQQLLDDNNNNTVIQEITSKDELKLGIPVLTSSMIQGSGETPISTPKDIPSGITVMEIESIPNRDQEKTDLKSKMIEVNQDLEELKMSLEKSLAELSIIEKSNLNLNEEKTREDIIMQTEEPTDDVIKQPIDDLDKKAEVYKPLADRLCEIENKFNPPEVKHSDDSSENQLKTEQSVTPPPNETSPICPSRKDRKGKNKSKKKGRREPETFTSQAASITSSANEQSESENKTEEKTKNSEEKGKQKAGDANEKTKQQISDLQFEPIENFEDALSSSVDDADINKTFEMIANELNKEATCEAQQRESNLVYPEINITPPVEDMEREKQQKNVNPASQPKNLLGRPNIPVQSNKTDYKKEKNKPTIFKQAKVKIKDSVDIEKKSSQSQTDNKLKRLNDKNEIESYSYVTNEKEEYVYKYSFRKVFLTNVCHFCRKELKQTRIPCKFCNLLFYCNQKHRDEDWPRHQNLCFAVSTIVHLKDQKHIYADAKNVSGQNYRLIRMQMILSCEKVLKRKLLPWEQEALLYPRICADVQCREWCQSKLSDCEGCNQLSYCTDHPEHLPLSHQRWCKSYALYQKLVMYQQSNGRLEPKMPGIVMEEDFVIPDKINEVLASMYEDKIDMSDIQYAALTQVATAPLTTGYGYQLYRQTVNSTNGVSKRSTFTVHVVGAELQFEADSLNKWEVFLLHLRPDVKDLRVVLLGVDLNPSNLPLHILGKIKLCENCRSNKRRVQFSFQDKMTYRDYWGCDDFVVPDIVCAFNPSIQRSSMYHGTETWMSTINCIMKQKVPFLITSYTLEELSRDLDCVKSYAEVQFKIVAGPKHNPFASVRPDRNFISDDETPLLFRNYCYTIICGV